MRVSIEKSSAVGEIKKTCWGMVIYYVMGAGVFNRGGGVQKNRWRKLRQKVPKKKGYNIKMGVGQRKFLALERGPNKF